MTNRYLDGRAAGTPARRVHRRSPRAGPRRSAVYRARLEGCLLHDALAELLGVRRRRRTRSSMPSGRGTSPRPPKAGDDAAAAQLRGRARRPGRGVPARRPRGRAVHAGDGPARPGPSSATTTRTVRTATAARRSSRSLALGRHGDRDRARDGARTRSSRDSTSRPPTPGAGPYHDRVPLVDSHCHLNADRFEGDADLVIGGARLAGVERILVPGWNVASSSERALDLVDRFPWLDAAVGVHPHDAAKVDDAGWARIVGCARRRPRRRPSARPGSTTTACSARSPTSSSTCAGTWPSRWRPGKPAILHCRSADGRRDAQDALLDELALAGVGDASLGSGVRGPAGGHHPLVLRPARLRSRRDRPRAGHQLLGARVPAWRGGVGRGRGPRPG